MENLSNTGLNDQIIYHKNSKTISRRGFMIGFGLSMLGVPMIACETGNNIKRAANTTNGQESDVATTDSTVLTDEVLIGCRLSNQNPPNNSVTGIAQDMGQSQNAHVTVDQNNDGSVDYDGVAGVGPNLQYNEGPKDLAGNQINPTIQDNVCVYGSK